MIRMQSMWDSPRHALLQLIPAPLLLLARNENGLVTCTLAQLALHLPHPDPPFEYARIGEYRFPLTPLSIEHLEQQLLRTREVGAEADQPIDSLGVCPSRLTCELDLPPPEADIGRLVGDIVLVCRQKCQSRLLGMA